MRIKKTFQGNLPENTVVNTQSNSQTNAYSCEYVNEHFLNHPIGSYYISEDPTSPASLFGGTWEQVTGRALIGAGKPSQNTNTNYGTLTSAELNYNFVAGQTLGEYLHDHQYGFRTRGWFGTLYENFDLYNGVNGTWESATGSDGPGNTTVASWGNTTQTQNPQVLARTSWTTRQYGIMPSKVVYMWKRVS